MSRPWTTRDERALESLWRHGDVLSSIAEALGRSPQAVAARASEMRDRCPSRRRKWTTKEMAEARRMWAEGVPARGIAKALGRTEGAVSWQVHQHRDEFPRRYRVGE